jgi:Phage integrase, N-terminal SAM-like domain
MREEWLPHHVMEATTREGYTYQIRKHILPWSGPTRMNEVMGSHVREWVTDLRAKNTFLPRRSRRSGSS